MIGYISKWIIKFLPYSICLLWEESTTFPPKFLPCFQGLKLRYHMELTNGETFWRKHFSADEQCKQIIYVTITQHGIQSVAGLSQKL